MLERVILRKQFLRNLIFRLQKKNWIRASKKLKRDKSTGYDDIMNEYILFGKTLLKPVLCKLFNNILCSGNFPEIWVKCILIPIFKKGNPDDPGNYRGISLVSHLGKLFTSLINSRLITWCKINNTLTDAQFGFRPGYGTSDAIFCLHSLISKSLRKGAACKDRPPTARDCDDVQSQGYTCSGVYTISLVTGRSANVLCDLQTAIGRWTVFQHRKDGSVNFDMNWSSYKDGFGDPYTESWLGNDKLYRLTSSRKTELLILMEAWDGVWKYASYSEFYVNSESDKYRLKVSGFSGTAGDSLMHMMSFTSPQGGQQFSTRDSDNDA
ncbi:Hypothetical predicted protein [Mytilus galloprovincialis]|uniref:Fibrinogen C-terminal domain-containing protein n=1 Tax=Mytilus galloprovincialis TaxID=29158 RepID=A0A8B6FC61_MYTGA|nr:Hypothetical predicted protein [Mytilus galloprovincialis]